MPCVVIVAHLRKPLNDSGSKRKSWRELWEDVNRLELAVTGTAEPRWVLIARRSDKTWTAVFTRRGENIRLISARRSRDN